MVSGCFDPISLSLNLIKKLTSEMKGQGFLSATLCSNHIYKDK